MVRIRYNDSFENDLRLIEKQQETKLQAYEAKRNLKKYFHDRLRIGYLQLWNCLRWKVLHFTFAKLLKIRTSQILRKVEQTKDPSLVLLSAK